MAENIGAVARAMMNCCLTELRLVAPRHGWPQQSAYPMSSGAHAVLDQAKNYATIAEAVADLHYVMATTANHREHVKRVYTPDGAAEKIMTSLSSGARVGILFGPERTGLENDDLLCANDLITAPLNPKYASLNLAQAVLLIAWEYHKLNLLIETKHIALNINELAAHKDVDYLLTRLETELDTRGFFTSDNQKPMMQRNLRNLFQRAELTAQDIRTLHGVVTALIKN